MSEPINLELSTLFKDGLDILQHDSPEDIKAFLGLNDRGWHVDNYENILDEMNRKGVKYKPIYGVLLIWHMSNGFSFESFGAVVGCVSQTCNRWVNQHGEFKAAHDIGMLRRRLEWEEIITTSAKGQNKGNAASIIFALKNYFPNEYKDKREVEVVGTVYVVDTGIKRPNDGQIPVDADYTVLTDDEPTSEQEVLKLESSIDHIHDAPEAVGEDSDDDDYL